MFEIGNSLREARARQGLDLPQLELETKIRAKYLRALEDERFDLLPAETYVRGFLRAYAERLGLDPQIYVDEYNSRFASGDEPALVRASAGQRSSRPRRLESHAVWIALAGIAVVTVLVIAAWRIGGGEEPEQPSPIAPAVTESPLQDETLEPTAPAPAPAPEEPEPLAPGSPPATPENLPATPAPPAEPETASLVVEAVRGRSTLVVRRESGDGEVIFEGTIEKGQRQEFEGRRLYAQFGKPANLRIVANGALVRTRPERLIVTIGGAREPRAE